jgi:hypothetical protein
MKKRFFYSFLGTEQKEHNIVTVLISEKKLPQEENGYIEEDKLPKIPDDVSVGAVMDILFTGGPRILKKCIIVSSNFDKRTPKKILRYEFPDDGMTLSFNGGRVWAFREYLRKI